MTNPVIVEDGLVYFHFPKYGGYIALEWVPSAEGTPLAKANYLSFFTTGEKFGPVEVEVWDIETMRSDVMKAFGVSNVLGG